MEARVVVYAKPNDIARLFAYTNRRIIANASTEVSCSSVTNVAQSVDVDEKKVSVREVNEEEKSKELLLFFFMLKRMSGSHYSSQDNRRVLLTAFCLSLIHAGRISLCPTECR